MQTTRRDFIGAAALAAGGLVAGRAAAAQSTPFYRGALLHLGSNMWGDYPAGPDDLAKSPEGMFPEIEMENDLKAADKLIREYWGLKPLKEKN